jgi:hypothetical protein
MLDRAFYFSLQGTVFDLYGDESAFLGRFFDTRVLGSPQVHLGIDKTQERLLRLNSTAQHVIVAHPKGQPDRAVREFPMLRTARFLSEATFTTLQPADLQDVDLLYVDSLCPPAPLLKSFGTIQPLFPISESYQDSAFSHLESRHYIGVHIRHGNGEHLGNRRISGDHALFGDYLKDVATQVLDLSSVTNIGDIVVLGDNADTITTLAKLTGGQGVGTDDLPSERFQDFIRADRQNATRRIEKVMFDFSVLAGAQHIVSGISLFSQAAHLLAGQGRHIIVT